MKTISCTIILLLYGIGAFCQSKIILEVGNFKNIYGVCRGCIFSSQASYESKSMAPFQCSNAVIKGKIARLEFINVPPGTYAAFVYHDANNNNKMDNNFLGIPREGYGASKNKLPYASAPTFQENRFIVRDKATLILPIKIRNIL